MYLISVYYVRTYYRLAYSSTGIWYNLKQSPLEYLLILTPALNTAFAFFFWITENPTREEYRYYEKLNGQHHKLHM